MTLDSSLLIAERVPERSILLIVVALNELFHLRKNILFIVSTILQFVRHLTNNSFPDVKRLSKRPLHVYAGTYLLARAFICLSQIYKEFYMKQFPTGRPDTKIPVPIVLVMPGGD